MSFHPQHPLDPDAAPEWLRAVTRTLPADPNRVNPILNRRSPQGAEVRPAAVLVLFGGATESDPLNLEFKTGSRHFFTVFGVGGNPTCQQYGSLGLGLSLPGKRLWADVDAQWLSYWGDWTFTADNYRQLIRGRATVGLQISRELAPFAGVSMNYRPPIAGGIEVGPGWGGEPDPVLTAWPGLFAGVQF